MFKLVLVFKGPYNAWPCCKMISCVFYREMLEQSITELRLTIDELEKRFDTLDDESEYDIVNAINMFRARELDLGLKGV